MNLERVAWAIHAITSDDPPTEFAMNIAMAEARAAYRAALEDLMEPDKSMWRAGYKAEVDEGRKTGNPDLAAWQAMLRHRLEELG